MDDQVSVPLINERDKDHLGSLFETERQLSAASQLSGSELSHSRHDGKNGHQEKLEKNTVTFNIADHGRRQPLIDLPTLNPNNEWNGRRTSVESDDDEWKRGQKKEDDELTSNSDDDSSAVKESDVHVTKSRRRKTEGQLQRMEEFGALLSELSADTCYAQSTWSCSTREMKINLRDLNEKKWWTMIGMNSTTQYLKFTPFSFLISLILVISSITYASLVISHTFGPAVPIFLTTEAPPDVMARVSTAIKSHSTSNYNAILNPSTIPASHLKLSTKKSDQTQMAVADISTVGLFALPNSNTTTSSSSRFVNWWNSLFNTQSVNMTERPKALNARIRSLLSAMELTHGTPPTQNEEVVSPPAHEFFQGNPAEPPANSIPLTQHSGTSVDQRSEDWKDDGDGHASSYTSHLKKQFEDHIEHLKRATKSLVLSHQFESYFIFNTFLIAVVITLLYMATEMTYSLLLKHLTHVAAIGVQEEMMFSVRPLLEQDFYNYIHVLKKLFIFNNQLSVKALREIKFLLKYNFDIVIKGNMNIEADPSDFKPPAWKQAKAELNLLGEIWLLIKLFLKREWESVVYNVTSFVQRMIVFIGRGSAAETDSGRTALTRHKQSQRQQRQQIRVQRKRTWKKWKRGPSAKFIAAQKAAESAIVTPADFSEYDGDIVEKLGPESLVQYIIIREYVDARVHDKRRQRFRNIFTLPWALTMATLFIIVFYVFVVSVLIDPNQAARGSLPEVFSLNFIPMWISFAIVGFNCVYLLSLNITTTRLHLIESTLARNVDALVEFANIMIFCVWTVSIEQPLLEYIVALRDGMDRETFEIKTAEEVQKTQLRTRMISQGIESPQKGKKELRRLASKEGTEYGYYAVVAENKHLLEYRWSPVEAETPSPLRTLEETSGFGDESLSSEASPTKPKRPKKNRGKRPKGALDGDRLHRDYRNPEFGNWFSDFHKNEDRDLLDHQQWNCKWCGCQTKEEEETNEMRLLEGRDTNLIMSMDGLGEEFEEDRSKPGKLATNNSKSPSCRCCGGADDEGDDEFDVLVSSPDGDGVKIPSSRQPKKGWCTRKEDDSDDDSEDEVELQLIRTEDENRADDNTKLPVIKPPTSKNPPQLTPLAQQQQELRWRPSIEPPVRHELPATPSADPSGTRNPLLLQPTHNPTNDFAEILSSTIPEGFLTPAHRSNSDDASDSHPTTAGNPFAQENVFTTRLPSLQHTQMDNIERIPTNKLSDHDNTAVCAVDLGQPLMSDHHPIPPPTSRPPRWADITAHRTPSPPPRS